MEESICRSVPCSLEAVDISRFGVGSPDRSFHRYHQSGQLPYGSLSGHLSRLLQVRTSREQDHMVKASAMVSLFVLINTTAKSSLGRKRVSSSYTPRSYATIVGGRAGTPEDALAGSLTLWPMLS